MICCRPFGTTTTLQIKSVAFDASVALCPGVQKFILFSFYFFHHLCFFFVLNFRVYPFFFLRVKKGYPILLENVKNIYISLKNQKRNIDLDKIQSTAICYCYLYLFQNETLFVLNFTQGEAIVFPAERQFPLRRSVKYLERSFDVVRQVDPLCGILTVFCIVNLNSPC